MQSLEEAIKRILNEKVAPMIQADGGDIEFVQIQSGVVTVRLLGACVGCPISVYTVKFGIEKALQELDGVKEVIALQE